jgi:5-methylcytosine-specific restriction endonuclease McrA
MPRDYRDPEYRAKMRAVNLGKTLTAETRAKMSAARMGHRQSAETRAKIREARLYPLPRGICAYCDGTATETDHIIPTVIPYGGSDHPDNIVPCCRRCNASKHARDPWTWLQDGLVGGERRTMRRRREI